MQSFKLAASQHNFKMQKSPCCNSVDCGCGQGKGDNFTKMFNSLVVFAYVLSAGLIVYSLLMFNMMWTQGSVNNQVSLYKSTATSQLQVPVLSYLPNVSEVWLQTAIFVETTGNLINNSISRLISGSSYGLTALFVTTGDILSRVPDILTAPRAFARAPGS